MKTKFLGKALEVAALGILLLLVTAPVTKPIWAQYVAPGVTIMGKTLAGATAPVQVDASGVMAVSPALSQVTVTAYSVSGVNPVNGAMPVTYSGTIQTVGISGINPSSGAWPTTYSGTQAVSLSGNSSSYTFSQITVSTTSAVQAIASNTSRKALMIQNQSGANVYLGTTSPVSATSGITLGAFGTPESRFASSSNVPTNTFYVLGTSSVGQTVSIGEGQ